MCGCFIYFVSEIMNDRATLYLCIGSNLGDRYMNLQAAVSGIEQKIGAVIRCASVYESSSWGYTSHPFLNSCLLVKTSLNPEQVMQAIKEIEAAAGRVSKKTEQEYEDRIIDIDILFYDDAIIQEPQLQIPHPKLHLRRFVLKPLWELAPGIIHPVLKKTITQLLQECPDGNVAENVYPPLTIQNKNRFSKLNFIVIEGNIGAGKTTLAYKIAHDFGGQLVLEHFADNPFLPRFYQDRSRYAFPVEMSFLADRYQQFTENTSQLDLFTSFMVTDYYIFKSLIFAQITLQEEEFKLYRKIFNFMYQEVKKPDLYVYLHQSTERLLENIKKRGREYERDIPAAYLEDVNKGYLEFIKTHLDLNTLVIDVSALDFVRNEEDYQYILDKIAEREK